ncbi:MAG: ATP-binding protein [Candidatus Bathyarchaeia archaeon]|nr:ATP-binding protein [Candidatus Bathyarchaeota archaeon]
MIEEGLERYFTDFDGRFIARLSSVTAVRRSETPSEATGISAKYECEVKAEYQRDLMGLLEEGMLLAVRNFKSPRHGGMRFTLLEASRIGPEHYGLRGLSDQAYYPYQFEIIQESVKDWETNDKATMMIRLTAIPLNYDLIIGRDGGISYVKGFTYPIIAEKVYVLNRDTVHQMYNRSILERMNMPWDRIRTSAEARRDPRLGFIKMFESIEERIPIYVDYDRLIRYHFGIFGFTGCGKSNLLSNILRRIIYHSRDAKIVIFDSSIEYPFLLQDVFADESIPSRIILETPIIEAGQLYRVVVKPRMFEGDERAETVFQRILSLNRIGCYTESIEAPPTYGDIIEEIENLRNDNVTRPNYVEAIDEVYGFILSHMRMRGAQKVDVIDEEFIHLLDRTARRAVEKFRVSDKSNLYGWATTRLTLQELLKRATVQGGEGYLEEGCTVNDLVRLIKGEDRLICLSIADPNLIKSLAAKLTHQVLMDRKREFRVDPSILFVFDEAQEFIPAYDKARGVERESTEKVETLLRQGRKYGLGGCIATQRIAYLNTNALQQLHTYFIGPLPRPYDRNLVSSTFTIDQSILEKTLEFAPGEWLLSSYVATGMENVPIFIKADDAEEEIENFLAGTDSRDET